MEPMTAREIWNQIPEETQQAITKIALEEAWEDSCPIAEVIPEAKEKTQEDHLRKYLQKIQKLLEDQNKILRDQNKILKDQNKALRKPK